MNAASLDLNGISSPSETSREIRLTNGLTFVAREVGGCFLGLSEVSRDGVRLRSARECIFPQIATPDGLEIVSYHLERIEETPELIRIVTRPVFRVMHRMEWMEHSMHCRINTGSWTEPGYPPVEGTVEWLIRPASEILDGVTYEGFASRYRYNVPGHPIYQIEEKATWEINGEAEGNTFIMRGGFGHPVARLEKGKGYQTGWTLQGAANPHVFQHLPLYAQLQGFTFQHDGCQALVTRHGRPSHVRSLFCKAANDDLFLHFNQYCFDLTDCVETPERIVLSAPLPGGRRHEIFNHFLGVRDQIHAEIRGHYGVRHDKARPSAHVETWKIARMENLPGIFEQLHAWGIRRTFLMPLWRSNETDIIPRFSDDLEKFGLMGNMCCPLELEIADCYGGWDGLRKALAPARESGLEVYLWYGSHFSSFSPLSKKIPDLFARDQTGQNQRNNYGHVLFAVNQNSRAYQEYLFDRFRMAGDCGIKGVFRDSHFNMAADTLNFLQSPYSSKAARTVTADKVGFLDGDAETHKPSITSMHDAEVGIQRVFQNELEMVYYVESAGLLGTPMCGTDYDAVRQNEWIFSDMESELNLQKVQAAGETGYEAYFRGLSVRLFYKLAVEINEWPSALSLSVWWDSTKMAPLLKSYAVVEPLMETMRLLPDEKGVIWSSARGSVVFTYKDFLFSIPEGSDLQEIRMGGLRADRVQGSPLLERQGIYALVPTKQKSPGTRRILDAPALSA